MAYTGILVETDGRGVATVTLNRPEVHNGYDTAMIAALLEAFGRLGDDGSVRVVVLRGAGKNFSAGADLKAQAAEAQAKESGATDADPPGPARAMAALDAMPKPTVALVQGACIGGGVGWIACCDVAIAEKTAFFSVPEVRLGFNPAPMIPFFVAAMGERAARRFLLTGERFDSAAACAIGLVHETCAPGELDDAAAPVIDALLHGGPVAMAETKATIRVSGGKPVADETLTRLEEAGRRSRFSEEADEGRASFLEKRKPRWYRKAEGA